MFKLAKERSSVAGLTWLIFGTLQALAGQPSDSAFPRVKPLAERPVEVKPWETSSSSPFGDFRMGGSDQRLFALSPDGKLLVSEDAGGWQLELWDTGTGKDLGRFGRIKDPVAVAFSPDGRTLATAGGGYSPQIVAVELWDIARRERVRDLDEGVNVTPFTAVAFAPDAKSLALAAGQGRRPSGSPAVHLWDVASGDEVRQLKGLGSADAAEAEEGRGSGSPSFDCLDFSPDGYSLALVSGGKVLLCEVATGEERCLLGVLPPAYDRKGGSGRLAAAMAFAPNGRTLAVACLDGLVRLWDVVSGRELLPLAGHQGGVRAVRFSADGKMLLSFGSDNKALTWPVAEAGQDWPRGKDLSVAALAALWDDLGSGDPWVRYAAVRFLAGSPDQALPFLRERLKPVPPVDSQRMAQLVADLKKEDFNERKRAAAELRQLGEVALPVLRKANEHGYDEILRKILERLESQYPTREQIRALTGLQVLERMRTEGGGRLLEDLSRGASESRLTRQARASLERVAKEAKPPGGGVKLEALWDDLASEDARQAFQAARTLAARPNEAVPLLGDRLRAVAARSDLADDSAHIARLIAELGSDEFRTREKAMQELSQLGKRAEAPLREALRNSPDPEVQRRIEALLQEPVVPKPSPERLQAARALEVLDWIATDEARHVLQQLSQGARNRWFKEAVAESLLRLGK